MSDADAKSGLKRKQDQDLKDNPGIGQSKGAFAMGGRLEDAKGENTVEGDVENDPGAAGPGERGSGRPHQ